MPSTKYFATLYKTSPDEHLKANVDALNLPHDGSREGMIASLMQMHNSWRRVDDKQPGETNAVPKGSQSANMVPGSYNTSAPAPTTIPLDPTAASFKSAATEAVSSPPAPAAAVTNEDPFAFVTSRKQSWADETQQEVDDKATAEAEAKVAAEKKADDGWATVPRSKSEKRALRKKQTKPEADDTHSTEAAQEKEEASKPCFATAETEVAPEIAREDEPKEVAEATQATVATRKKNDDAPLAQEELISEPTPEAIVEDKEEVEVAPTTTSTRVDEQIAAPEPTEPLEVKETAAAAATPTTPVGTKKTASRRRKQKRAAKKAQVAVIPSLSSSEAVINASDGNENDSEGLQETETRAETVESLPSTSNPSHVAVNAKTPPTISTESSFDDLKPPAVADSWDDHIDIMSTIQAYQFHVAHVQEFGAEQEAQARFAAGLPPAGDGPMTAADLQRVHEEAEKAKQSEAAHSTTTGRAEVSAAEESEGLPEPKTKLNEVELPALQPSASADEPEIVFSTAAEDLPVPVPEINEHSSKYARQFSITDFFKKAPVKVKDGFSTIPDKDIPASTKPIDAIIVDATEPFAAADGVDDLRGAPGLVKTEFVNFEVPPAIGLEESNAPSDTIEEDLIDYKNVADYLDYLESDDEQSEFEHTEGLPATSATAVSNAKGAQASPQTLPVDSSAEEVEAQEQVIDSSEIDENITAPPEDNEQFSNSETTSYEPVVARQKKKRTKAQRNAAKKHTATASTVPTAVPAVDHSLEVEDRKVSDVTAATSTPALHVTVLEPALTGRGKRREKRKAAKPSVRATCSVKDAEMVTVTLPDNIAAEVEKADEKEDEVEGQPSGQYIIEAYTTSRRKGKKTQKNKLSGAQRRKVWKPTPAPLPTPPKAPVALIESRFVAALAHAYHTGTFNLPWVVVLGLVLAWLSAVGIALYELELI